MLRLVTCGLLLALASLPADAQPTVPGPSAAVLGGPSTCDTGSAESDLDIADVRATLYNVGSLFWRGSVVGYTVPQASGLSPLFTAGLWVSGDVSGEPRFAGSTYGAWEFWPGPLDANGQTHPAQCAAFDRLWKVSIDDLRAMTATGVSTRDLREWPVAYGAPFFVDLDGDDRRGPGEPRLTLRLGDEGYGSRTLDLEADERPDLVGDQAVWWVMNDAGNAHGWSGSDPLRVEVQVLAFAVRSEDTALSQATFYEYTVINRGPNPIENARLSVWADPEVGDFSDDYLATDPARGLVVGYNGDDFDGGDDGYGASAPAIGIDVLSGADGAMAFTSGTGVTAPPLSIDETARAARRNQEGLWKDGTPLTVGGDGHDADGSAPTAWAFDGDVLGFGFWTEEQPVVGAGPRTPGERKALLTAGPQTLAPGEHRTLDVAVLFAVGAPDRSRTHSVSRLLDISDAVQAAYDGGGSGFEATAGDFSGIRDVRVTYTPPPPTPPAAALSAPADGTDFNDAQPAALTFEWAAAPGATVYDLELSGVPTFDGEVVRRRLVGTSATVAASDLPPSTTTSYWRVTARNWGGSAPTSPVRQFSYRTYRPEIVSIEVTANADGPLTPPEPGAADFSGYPTPDGGRPGVRQQASSWIWLFAASEAGPYEEFVSRAFRNDNADRFFPSDYEVRFTGASLALKDGFMSQSGPPVEVPFEIWNIGAGTPDDPSDDVRLIPLILDVDGDGTYNLSGGESQVSSGPNDPETDWIYWYEPADMSPGEAGYLAYENGGTLNTAALGPEVMARQTFVGWNLGEAPPYPVSLPEAGTVFRVLTTNPAVATAGTEAPERLGALVASPNPVRGAGRVAFALPSPGAVRLRVVDVLGREVAALADGLHPAGGHEVRFDATGLAAGVYVVVLDADGQRVSRAITVVR